MTDTTLAIFCILIGAAIGSFLNVVIIRLPQEGASIAFPSSHCTHCKSGIRWFDNIPVVSFLFLMGRCRNCGTRISFQYPLVEILMACLSYALFTRYFISFSFIIYFLFCAALLAIIFIDFHHQIIPDVISLPGIVAGFAFSFVNPEVTWQSSGLGILTGGGSLYLIAITYYLLTKREGMGGGDIKLLAMIGAFLGWQSLPFVVFGSSVLGSIIGIFAMIRQRKGGRTVIPYGPFLSGAAILYLFFSVEILEFFRTWFLPPEF